MYLVFNSGKVVAAKCAQCGQVIEAYSTMVTLASSLPSCFSGSAPGFSSSAMSTSPEDSGTLAAAGVAGVEAGTAGAAGFTSAALASSPESLHAASIATAGMTASEDRRFLRDKLRFMR